MPVTGNNTDSTTLSGTHQHSATLIPVTVNNSASPTTHWYRPSSSHVMLLLAITNSINQTAGTQSRCKLTPAMRSPWICFALYDPVTFTFCPKTIPLVGYAKVIPNTKFEDFGIIRFWVMLHTNKWMYRHTDAQTDANERFTPATVVGVSNEQKYVVPNPPTNYKYSQCRQNVGIWPTNYFQPTLMPQIKSNQ